MPICNLQDLKSLLKPGQKLLGMDLGERTIGLALSDETWLIASPIATIRRKDFKTDCAALLKIIEERGAGGLVLGLPITLAGDKGIAAQKTQQFAIELMRRPGFTDLPLAYWDERLSTAASRRLMIDADLTRKRQDELVDKMAAGYFLQAALEALRAGADMGEQAP